MNTKQLQSQINLISARITQISDSGYFTLEEIENYTKEETQKLTNLQTQLDTLNARNIEVIVESDTNI